MKFNPNSTAENSELTVENRFPQLHLITALTLMMMVILFFAWEFYQSKHIQSAGSEQIPIYYFYAFSVVIVMLIVSLSAWLATARALNSARKAFSVNDSDRKQTEEELRLSETYFRELLDNANDLFYTTDLQGNFTSFNKAGEIITGYTREEAVSKTIQHFLSMNKL